MWINYFQVSYTAFSSGREKNFNKYPASEVDFAGGMYDFDSLMHYGNYAFSKNRKATLVALKNPKLQFGRRLKLSKTDILQLNAMYDCKSKRFLRKVTTFFFNRPPLSSSSPSSSSFGVRLNASHHSRSPGIPCGPSTLLLHRYRSKGPKFTQGILWRYCFYLNLTLFQNWWNVYAMYRYFLATDIPKA